MFWGKMIAMIVGTRLFGLWGGVIGFWLGSIFDDALRARRLPLGDTFPMGAQQAFFEATFLIMGTMAKVDGPVQTSEIRAVESIMARFALDPSMKQEAVRLFREGKTPDFDPEPVLARFYQETVSYETLRYTFIEMQLTVALSDGPLHPAEKAFLLQACKRVAVWPQHFSVLRAKEAYADQAIYDAPLASAYRVLGLASTASDAELKQHYRRLMNQHHPDKVLARGLPESQLRAAKEKTQAIRAAYDQIRNQRAMRA